MATVCVDASINRLHNIQKLLMAIYIYIYMNTLEKKEGEGEGLYHCQECKGGKKREGWPQIRSSVGINREAAPPIHSH